MKRIKGSSRKHRKMLGESKTVELEDRISSLPDNVIGHILSLLPTKYAVGTSALSTLWKDQWKLIPDLDIDDMMFMDKAKRGYTNIDIQTRFINFVYRVLHLNKAPQICQFRLKCHKMLIDASDLEAWTTTVLSRKVLKLELDMLTISTRSCEAFSSSTLLELRLGSLFLLEVPSVVDLPSLKTIYLHHINFKDNESAKRLFSNCPMLEDLTMLYCDCNDMSTFNISSSTVKRLTVKNYRNQSTIELNTPSLEHLNYVGRLAEGFIPKRIESLAKVCFHVPCHVANKKTLLALAQGISNVQSLYLSGQVLEKLEEFRVDFQPLVNLRTLVIGYNTNGAWNRLPRLLKSCPNLKYLELNGLFDGEESTGEYFIQVPLNVPAFLSHPIEEIKIHECNGCTQEMEMIKYLLSGARVLKKLTVISAMRNAQEERKIRNSLLAVTSQMAPLDCQVVIVPRFHVRL